MGLALVLAGMAGLPGAAHAVSWGGGAISDLSPADGSGSIPSVRVSDDGGRATSVWTQASGATLVIQSASAVIDGAGAVWGTARTVSAPDGLASQAQLAMSADGTRAIALWVTTTDTSQVIQAASAVIEGTAATWGAVSDVSDAILPGWTPHVAMSADGTRATAVWSVYDGLGFSVQSASAVVGGTTITWGPASTRSDLEGSSSFPGLGLSRDGTRATVVWQRKDPDNSMVVQSVSGTVDGTTAAWGPVATLSAPSADALAAMVGVSDDGRRATASWQRAGDGANGAQSASAVIDGTAATWGAVTDLAPPGQTAEYPTITVSGDGARATAVWEGDDVVRSASATIDGTVATWGASSVLSTPSPDPTRPQVRGSRDGRRVTAAWYRSDGSVNVVQSASAAVEGNGAAWGPVSDLSAAGTDASHPRLDVSADGNRATVVWTRFYGSEAAARTRVAASDSVVQSRSGASLSQTITFPAPADTRVDQGPVTLVASASSGLPVTLTSSTPDVCTVTGGVAALTAAGTCTVTARQPGDATYAAAPEVTTSFGVTPVPTIRQRPVRPLGLPARLRHHGVTRLLRLPVETNAGQTARVMATCRPLLRDLVPAGDTVRACRVLRGPTAVRVWISGSRPVVVRVRVHAGAVPGYTSYTRVRTYRVASAH